MQVTVNAPGNMVPLIQNTAADPGSGAAPLEVHFQADAIDPDGPENQLVYRWDFGDGGAQFGADVHHIYRTPGTFKAKVKVTDAGGASTTSEEITITVANPPGNAAPFVEALADPTSGRAPLRVRFSSAASDPDGDQLLSVWDFGDGVKAGGRTRFTRTRSRGRTPPRSGQGPGRPDGHGQRPGRRLCRDRGRLRDRPAAAGRRRGGRDPEQAAGAAEQEPQGRARGQARPALHGRCEARCRVTSVLRIAGGDKQRLGASRVRVITAGTSAAWC